MVLGILLQCGRSLPTNEDRLLTPSLRFPDYLIHLQIDLDFMKI